jgi:hypothetical protein
MAITLCSLIKSKTFTKGGIATICRVQIVTIPSSVKVFLSKQKRSQKQAAYKSCERN